MNDLKKLPKIIRQCMTIGELPTSYKISMTYEEQLLWFCNFLENKVIPVVNNNSQVVEELKNYITNLDVQEEINNKLNEMAQDGTLSEIIAQYIQLQGLLCFNDIEEMKNAQNLVNGSFVKTFGQFNYKDGNGELYKIRNITNQDIIDEINIIALYDENLIAERIVKNEILLVDDFKKETDTDDTLSITRAIEFGRNFTNPTLKFNKRNYNISDIFNIDYKLNIDFNNATINFMNNSINISGDEKAIFYYKNNPSINFVDVTSELEENSNIITANLDNVNENDYLVLKFYDTVNNELSSDHYFLTKVLQVNEHDFTIDYIIPAKFKEFGYTAKVGKVTSVFNDISIKNVIIKDLSTTEELKAIVNAITFSGYYANCIIENIQLYNLGCHGINLRHTNNFYINNIFINKTKVQDAGHGYALRLQANLNLTVENSIAINCRHFIDNTMDENFTGNNLKAFKCDTPFSSHGQYEFNINYNNILEKNCLRSCGFGDSDFNVTSYFMNFTKNVNINNALFYDKISARGLTNFNFNNLTLECEDTTENLIGLSDNCKISNSKLNGYLHFYILKNLHREILSKSLNELIIDKTNLKYFYMENIQNNEGSIKLINSSIYAPYISQSRGLRVKDILIDNCSIDGETNSQPTTIYNYCTNINFTNNIIKNSIKLQFSDNLKNINIQGNKWIDCRENFGQYLLALTNFQAQTIQIINNTIAQTQTGSRGFLVFNDESTCESEIVSNNNFRYGLNGFLFPRAGHATSTKCIVTNNIFENLAVNKPDTTPLTNQLFNNNLFI